MQKIATVDTIAEMEECPVARCPGFVSMELSHEDENYVVWDGQCSHCKREFSISMKKGIK